MLNMNLTVYACSMTTLLGTMLITPVFIEQMSHFEEDLCVICVFVTE